MPRPLQALIAALLTLLVCSAAAGEAPLRVACVGDSITLGGGATGRDGTDNSYPAQLAGLLGDGYSVRNFGVGGTTLLASGDQPWRKTPQLAAARAFAPDVVVILLGTNDTKPQNWAKRADFPADYRALIAEFSALPSAPRIILCSPIPAFPGKWGIDGGRIRDGVVPLVQSLAKELSLPLVDLHSLFAEQSALVPDSVHPNAAGYGLIAKAIAAEVARPQVVEQAGTPDALRDGTGRPVCRAAWPQRRAEILELFRAHVYGRNPVDRPRDQSFAITDPGSDALGGTAVRKQAEIRYSGPGGAGRIGVVAFIPKASRRAPGLLLICNRSRGNIDPSRARRSPFWPAEEIVARGYAAIAYHVEDCDADRNDGFNNGVHALFDPPGAPRAADAWGTIAAWAWGASRVMDWIVAEPQLDPARIAVVGHSRGGKAALWAGAQDERFAMVISNNSGCTGAALTRGTTGETVAKINRTFPHWFCTAYHGYSERPDALPVDQHMLLALVAPRPLYVASASADANAWPAGEFQACVDASPVFRLLGGTGIATTTMPGPDGFSHGGGIGYHLRQGEHDLKAVDWQRFMDFADLKWPQARSAAPGLVP